MSVNLPPWKETMSKTCPFVSSHISILLVLHFFAFCLFCFYWPELDWLTSHLFGLWLRAYCILLCFGLIRRFMNWMSIMESWVGHVIMYPCTTDISIGPGTICIMGDIYVGTQVGLRVHQKLPYMHTLLLPSNGLNRNDSDCLVFK